MEEDGKTCVSMLNFRDQIDFVMKREQIDFKIKQKSIELIQNINADSLIVK